MVLKKSSDKWNRSAIFSAKDLVSYLSQSYKSDFTQSPPNVIMCFSPYLADVLHNQLNLSRRSFLGARLDVSLNEDWGVLSGLGIGAPAAAAKLEELKALGAQRVISVGTAGTIKPDHKAGDVLVCYRALRGEGCSSHYLPPEESVVLPSMELNEWITGRFDRYKVAWTGVATWTTDAPYRETPEEIEELVSEGFDCIEMETSALFAVAKVREIQMSSVYVISDELHSGKWVPHFRNRRVKDQLIALSRALLKDVES